MATIDTVEDIEGKDKIKYIGLKNSGWRVIGDNTMKPGDRIIYIEYDTIINPTEQFEFLRKRCWSEKYKGFRISCMRMSGVVSYGLLVPVDIVEHEPYNLSSAELGITPDGFDLSETLGVTALDDSQEYDKSTVQKVPPTKLQRFIKKHLYFIWKAFYNRKPDAKGFPTFAISKSDETRIETLNYLFSEEYKGRNLYVTTKMDGQSITFAIYKGNFYVASRNQLQYKKPIKKAVKELTKGNVDKIGKASDFLTVACKFEVAKYMVGWAKKLGLTNIAIQGELCGPGIQKNKMGLPGLSLFIYNVFDSDKQRYFKWVFIESFCEYSGIESVPFVEYTTMQWNNIAEIKEYSKGNYDNGTPREGIVLRSNEGIGDYIEDAKSGQHGCFSFKCINPDFDLKYSGKD
jgi:hypothetical protein